MIASHSCCRFVGCTSMMWISRSTTSQRCSIRLRSGDCGGHLSKVNSLSCSRNQSEMIWASWHGATHPSHSLFQLLPSGRRYWSIRAAPPDCSTAFSTDCERPELNSHRPSLKTTYKPSTSWNMDHCTPLPPSNLPHHGKKKMVQFEVCYTQVSGPVQPLVVTHSPLFALDTFHTLLCVYNPTKRLKSICMITCSCTTNHLTLFSSQLLDLRCFSLHMYSIHLKHSYSLYSLYFVVYV